VSTQVQEAQKIARALHFATQNAQSAFRCFASRDFAFKISDFSSTVRDFSLDTEAQIGRRIYLFQLVTHPRI
jgi:hypothetical protein